MTAHGLPPPRLRHAPDRRTLLGWWAGLLLPLGAQCAAAAPLTLAKVRLDETLAVQGHPLVLNGAGIRYRAVFQVYVAALYLGRKTHDADEALRMAGAKRIAITMLRDIEAAELGKLMTRGVEDNLSRPEFARIVPGLARLGQLFAEQKKLLSGEAVLIDWVPGTGTLITVRGQVQGPAFVEPEFFLALLRIWLGQTPVDMRLKDALLGISPDTHPNRP